MGYANNAIEIIGKTPLLRLNAASKESGALILGKCEFMNPNGSVKDRIGANLIHTAIEQGLINENSVIIEPTSGNTGVALASVCAVMGIKLILTMPSSMSMERQKLLRAFGAKIVLTEPTFGMKGAVSKAEELAATTPNSFIPQQFANSANPDIHRRTTALEIWDALDGKIDIFVAAVGTGGTITGVGEVLKAKNPNIKVIAVEPSASRVLNGGAPAPHKIQGIGAGFVPQVLNTKIYDNIIAVTNEDAFATARGIAKSEGILVGISAGANVWAATQIGMKPENAGKTIVTILCDTGERYLSTTLFEDQ
jgi:cysteine synthase